MLRDKISSVIKDIEFSKNYRQMLRDTIRTVLKDIRELNEAIDRKDEEIRELAFKLLDELRQIPEWEVLIDTRALPIYEQYRPVDDFFRSCSVEYDSGNLIGFKKSFVDGTEIMVLTMVLHKPLEEQVKDRLDRKVVEDYQKQRDMQEYLRIKKKYNLE